MNNNFSEECCSPRVLRVFNRYLYRGGEELAVESIDELIAELNSLRVLDFSSADWIGESSPTKIAQVFKMFHNEQAVSKFRDYLVRSESNVALFHNILPVGSLGLYTEANRLGIPVIQYIHSFRPFSVSGSLWINGKIDERALRGNFWPEVKNAAWQESVVKSLVMASLLKWFRVSGMMETVTCWIAVSDFMRGKFIEAGINSDKIVTLRHSWRMMDAEPSDSADDGYYLLLARLVPEKGIEQVMLAWKLLEKKLGARCPLLVVAGEGNLSGFVERKASRSDFIEYVGLVGGDKKRQLISRSRAMIVPSIWYEPLGLVIYEAYDYGKPVVASIRGGLSETVFDGVTGIQYDPGQG